MTDIAIGGVMTAETESIIITVRGDDHRLFN
jgi:hypothetical protein